MSQQPLANKRIVVTRAVHQADELNHYLIERGAIPIAYPCIAIVPPADTSAFDLALQQAYDWAIFTSPNAVFATAQRLQVCHATLQVASIAAIGDKTAQTVQKHLGRTADCEAWDSSSQGVLALMASQLATHQRVLLPQSDLADEALVTGLRHHTPHITHITAYHTVISTEGEPLLPRLHAHEVDVLTLTSPSTLAYFLQRLSEEGGSIQDLEGVVIACIGSITAEQARQRGLVVHVVPTRRNLLTFVQTLEAFFSQ